MKTFTIEQEIGRILCDSDMADSFPQSWIFCAFFLVWFIYIILPLLAQTKTGQTVSRGIALEQVSLLAEDGQFLYRGWGKSLIHAT